MEALGPMPADLDLRRPALSLVSLWVVVALLALAIASLAALVVVGVLIEPQSTIIDPTRLPPGTQVSTIEGSDGLLIETECPALLGRSQPAPPWCADSDSVLIRIAFVAPLVASLALFAAFRAGRRVWTCIRLRHAPAPPWPPAEYHQEGMPWGFWLSVTFVGLLALTLDVLSVVALLGGDLSVSPMGAMFWTAILFAIVSRYGFRSAVSLVAEGDFVVWRAPMRTVRVRTADIIGFSTSPSSLLGERPGKLNLADGSSLAVSVPNRRHAILFTGFLQAKVAGDQGHHQSAG